MSGSADRLPRLLALVPYLRTHPQADVDGVAAFFGITARQLRADVELLFCCGLPGGSPGDLIDIDLGVDTITLLDPQTLDRPLRLTADEATALTVAVRALADVPGLTERAALERVLVKLEAASGEAAAGVPALQVAWESAETPAARLGPVLGTAREALARGRRLHLRHLSASRDEVTERDVDPLRLATADGYWYLDGWCHLAEAQRTFRLDRVLEATVLDVPAAPPAEAVPRDLADGVFRSDPGQQLVELELTPAAAWVADYYPCESVGPGPDGGLRIGLRTPATDWVRALVLRLAGAGRVLSPPVLAAEVADEAARAAAAYDLP